MCNYVLSKHFDSWPVQSNGRDKSILGKRVNLLVVRHKTAENITEREREERR